MTHPVEEGRLSGAAAGCSNSSPSTWESNLRRCEAEAGEGGRIAFIGERRMHLLGEAPLFPHPESPPKIIFCLILQYKSRPSI